MQVLKRPQQKPEKEKFIVKKDHIQRPWNKKGKVWLEKSEQKVVLQNKIQETDRLGVGIFFFFCMWQETMGLFPHSKEFSADTYVSMPSYSSGEKAPTTAIDSIIPITTPTTIICFLNICVNTITHQVVQSL